MIIPLQRDHSLLQDVSLAEQSPLSLHIWWLGQSGFLVTHNRIRVLFDPYLSDSLTRKYANTDKPHIRLSERVIDPALLSNIDVVTSSHNHTDHLDAETLLPIFENNPGIKMLIPEANRQFVAERLGTKIDWPVGLVDGSEFVANGFSISAIPAAHEQLDQDGLGRNLYLGFILKLGPWTLYHAGDTVRYPSLDSRLCEHSIDVALLPINGRLPERRVSGNLWGREAAQLASDISAKWVIPCHYDMFAFNTVSPREFVDECGSLGQPFRLLQLGERISLGHE